MATSMKIESELERENTNEVAKKKILSIYKSLNLEYKFSSIESDNYASCGGVYFNGELIAESAGKGNSSEVGALAEGLEHFYLLMNTASAGNQIVSSKEYRQQAIVRIESSEVFPIVCNKFTEINLKKGRKSFYIPTSLVNPFFDDNLLAHKGKSKFYRYSSNSGTAFGLTKNEAILHAINEVLERDFFSRLLFDLLNNQEKNFKLLCKNSIPKGLINRIDLIENKFDCEVLIVSNNVDNNRVSIFSFFAVALFQNAGVKYAIPQVGSGASLFSKLALSRSISELYQVLEFYDSEAFCEDTNAIKLINLFPKLKKPSFFLKKIWNYLVIKNSLILLLSIAP